MKRFLSLLVFFCCCAQLQAQPANRLAVIAYYSGSGRDLDSFRVEQLTHIIFSFCHLQDNRLHVDNKKDSAIIRKLVSLKKRNPAMKVLLSLGGWGGCQTCSDVFSAKKDREAFAASVKELCLYFGTDGIDLDWEYPAIEGFPGHHYKPEDRENFTDLVKLLRETLGGGYEISFAAGGFNDFLERSIDWNQVMGYVDRVHIMTYDLVNGYSAVTGHHTALYSTSSQTESTDNATQKLLALGIPAHQLVIGAAFYGRVWEKVPATGMGLYQPGKFLKSIAYSSFTSQLPKSKGFVRYWDEEAKAPYIYNEKKQWFVTYDDPRSLGLKTQYALDRGLGGIMFWELGSDVHRGGLLDAIHRARISYTKQ